MCALMPGQVDSQMKSHKLEGTLIISAVCTHKVANIFAPFVLDPDKYVARSPQPHAITQSRNHAITQYRPPNLPSTF